MVTGIGLFSGGLDSILSVRLLQQQNIRIEVVSFVTPFFGPETAIKAVKQLGIPHHIIDITEIHLPIVKNPRYGYGRNMNPCIDCHALMFNQAGELMKKKGAHFLFSGEVLGERPMSQNRNSLRTVARHSGFQEYILRPLSARLLPMTMPEQEGLVDREKLLDLQGRSRKPQIELAKQLGLTYFPGPAGGCRLTDPGFSNRLRDLLKNNEKADKRDMELLSLGRHLRISNKVKIIVGRNEKENNRLESLKEKGEIILSVEDIPGPLVIIPSGADDDAISLAASVCVRYSDAPENKAVPVSVFTDNVAVGKVFASACSQDSLKKFII